MDNKVELKLTEDGSHTLYVQAIDETYHSTHGAVNESQHVFIEAGFNQCPKAELNILEIGFGTGLNAYLAALASEQKKSVHFTTVEKFPLPQEVWSKLNYADSFGLRTDLFNEIQAAQWEIEVKLSPTFHLHKIQADFSSLSLSGEFDLIFYDAFSPDKQPELWTDKIFEELYAHTASGGLLTTYCAKGAVRRAMQNVGYVVERIPGPKGKREMLRAKKL
jgi:tRNA U34 5-methylaminomethyl-2-thiouridine-forming methyltransferase MnmC